MAGVVEGVPLGTAGDGDRMELIISFLLSFLHPLRPSEWTIRISTDGEDCSPTSCKVACSHGNHLQFEQRTKRCRIRKPPCKAAIAVHPYIVIQKVYCACDMPKRRLFVGKIQLIQFAGDISDSLFASKN